MQDERTDNVVPFPLQRIDLDENEDGTLRRDWSRAAAAEILEHVAPAMREAADRLGNGDPIGRDLHKLATRWSLIAHVHVLASVPGGVD